ncbi:hypothetical protein [Paenibacillus glacialis]|uniref:Uncharacterized protein n=1 Tax=Paenibacillus glacialis TaxID=494026 RepID=A0A168C206_9BACL|nr:hypothetical protein [Paenibacillus glacialis]OAB32977.1 hypothetical protein PGLA_26215 [Paenibacillus glacialis]
MTDLKLAQSFSMMALNGQSSIHMTTVKKVALRSMAAAVILEVYLDSGFTEAEDKLTLHKDIRDASHPTLYREAVIQSLIHKKDGAQGDLRWWLKRASNLSNKKLKKFEHAMSDSLKELSLLEEIPGLLGCDLYYDSAGVEMKDYRSNIDAYTRVSENIRAEILEDGFVTDEIICMLWLLRESGCMHDFFSRSELEKVNARMNELYQSALLAKALFPIQIHHGIELGIKQFLHLKTRFVKTSIGSTINFFFPMLERSKAVFIETEAWFSNPNQRLNDVITRLESYGHEVKVIEKGSFSTIKIDNLVYDAMPHYVMMKVPIQGVRLMPKRPL